MERIGERRKGSKGEMEGRKRGEETKRQGEGEEGGEEARKEEEGEGGAKREEGRQNEAMRKKNKLGYTGKEDKIKQLQDNIPPLSASKARFRVPRVARFCPPFCL